MDQQWYGAEAMVREPYAALYEALHRVAAGGAGSGRPIGIEIDGLPELDLNGWYEYDPDPDYEPFIHLRHGLTDEQRVMVLIHELGHAVLHPPGSPIPIDTSADGFGAREEHVVHAAARYVCDFYGFPGYHEVKKALGVPPELCPAEDRLDDGERAEAVDLAGRLKALIDTP